MGQRKLRDEKVYNLHFSPDSEPIRFTAWSRGEACVCVCVCVCEMRA